MGTGTRSFGRVYECAVDPCRWRLRCSPSWADRNASLSRVVPRNPGASRLGSSAQSMRHVAFVAEGFGLSKVLSVIPAPWRRDPSHSEVGMPHGRAKRLPAKPDRSIKADNSERKKIVVRRNRAQPALPSRAAVAAHGRLPVWAALPEGCRRTVCCDGAGRASEGGEGVWRGFSSRSRCSGVVEGLAFGLIALPRAVRRHVGVVHPWKGPGAHARRSGVWILVVVSDRLRSCVARSKPTTSLSRLALRQACVGVGATVRFGLLRYVPCAIGVFEGFGPREFR